MNKSALEIIKEDYQNVLAQRIDSLIPLKNTTVVITGGGGFMGTWLAGLLAYLNDHHQFNTKIFLLARNFEKFQLTRSHLAHRTDIHLLAADIRHTFELPKETNWLIHCAATPNNRLHASNPLETMSVIANGTAAILQAIERCSHFKMLLNISSGAIYGAQPLELDSITENFAGAPKCNTVSSAYAEAKRYAETLCNAARSQSRLPIITVRPFAFIGPYLSLELPWALNNFMRDALFGNDIHVLSDGKSIRSYLYASDMAYWLLKILVQGKSGEIYNVGSEQNFSLADLAQLVAEQIIPHPQVKLRTLADLLPASRFIPNTSLAKNNLGLTVSIDVATAIKRTMQWHQLILNTEKIQHVN